MRVSEKSFRIVRYNVVISVIPKDILYYHYYDLFFTDPYPDGLFREKEELLIFFSEKWITPRIELEIATCSGPTDEPTDQRDIPSYRDAIAASKNSKENEVGME